MFLLISLILIQIEARQTLGYYDFDDKVDKVHREYNEKENFENISIFLSENSNKIDFLLQSKYEENSRIALYSGFPGELIVEESCCGRDKRYYLDYYLYNEDINDYILYKTLKSNGIFKENIHHMNIFNGKSLTLSYPTKHIGINGNIYKRITLKKPNRLDAKKALKALSLMLKNKQEKYITVNFFYFYSILSLYPMTKKNTTLYNDTAYYLQKAGENEEAIYLLEKILEKYPNRTVAHYNLADAYWELGDKKKAVESYNTYIEQMCNAGKEKRIPKVVIDRASTKL